MPPVSPMLAKPVSGVPAPGLGRGRAGVRAEVGRLPLHRVPRRRRGRARQPQREAADPLLPRGRRGGPALAARALRRRRRDRRAHRRPARLRRAAAAHPPGRHPGATARRGDAGVVRGLRPARARRRRPDGAPFAERRTTLERARRGVAAADPPHAGVSADLDEGARWFERLRGRRARRGDLQAARLHLPARQAGDAQGQARAHRRLRRRRASGRTSRRAPTARRSSARSCSASTTTPGSCSPSGSSASFPMARRAELVERAGGVRPRAGRRPPVGRLARRRGARAEPAPERCRDGARARPWTGTRCAPSSWSRSATTPWRGRGSGTPRSSSAGARTARPESCTYDQLERPVRYDLGDVLDG